MFIVLVFLILLCAILMAVAVLLQAGRGGGLAGIGGGQTQQVLGARQAPDFLEKVTWGLGVTFLVLCVIATFFTNRTEEQNSILQERGPVEAPAVPPQAPPVGPAPGDATAPGGTPAPGGEAPSGEGTSAPIQ